MANKTAKPILEHLWHELTGGEVLHYSEQARLAEASRQLYEAEIERIGEDEWGIDKVSTQIAQARNQLRAELRAKARAFYGITETEGSAE